MITIRCESVNELCLKIIKHGVKTKELEFEGLRNTAMCNLRLDFYNGYFNFR